MVKKASSPSSSPVTITVSSGGKGGAIRSMGLTSPVPRSAVLNNPNSPLSGRGNRGSSGGRRTSTGGRYDEEVVNSEYVTYTVHMPPTPDHNPISASQTSLNEDDKNLGKPERSFISGTIFTGGFNSVTRGHVLECSMERKETMKSGILCGMKGCDEKAMQGKVLRGGPCECGFKICRECYLDCVGSGGGHCPGCKEPYKDVNDDDGSSYDDDEPRSEAEDQALPLPSMADFKPDKRLSLVKSFKAPNHDFDHTRWLYETKGTYGYGNAVWPKDGYGFGSGVNGFEHPPDFGEKTRRPLTRKVNVSAAIISPYR